MVTPLIRLLLCSYAYTCTFKPTFTLNSYTCTFMPTFTLNMLSTCAVNIIIIKLISVIKVVDYNFYTMIIIIASTVKIVIITIQYKNNN